jgi:2'-5' RNA ligase
MIWATGEPSEELKNLQRNLEANVYSEPFPADEKREKGNYFAPHITLGRIKSWEFKSIEPEEVPEINEEISITIPVESIEIMESELKRGGPEYIVLESFQLKI